MFRGSMRQSNWKYERAYMTSDSTNEVMHAIQIAMRALYVLLRFEFDVETIQISIFHFHIRFIFWMLEATVRLPYGPPPPLINLDLKLKSPEWGTSFVIGQVGVQLYFSRSLLSSGWMMPVIPCHCTASVCFEVNVCLLCFLDTTSLPLYLCLLRCLKKGDPVPSPTFITDVQNIVWRIRLAFKVFFRHPVEIPWGVITGNMQWLPRDHSNVHRWWSELCLLWPISLTAGIHAMLPLS